MNPTPITKTVFFAVAVIVSAAPLHAGSYENDWLTGAAQFDNAGIHGKIKSPAAAAMSSLPQSYRGEARSRSVTRRAGQDSITVTLKTPVYRVTTTLSPVLTTYEDVECREVSGEGRGDWKGFFSAPKREKPKLLAEAVQGIGDATARCIVNSGAFDSKPRSWSAFKGRIRQAEESCGKGIYHRVVVQYGRQNARRLGYYSEQDCRVVQVEELVFQEVEHKEFSHTAPITVQVSLRNAPLLASESETVTVNYDGVTASVDASSRHNRYRTEKTGEGLYVLEGERQRTTPNNTLAVQILERGLGKVLQIADSDFQPAVGFDFANAQTMAVVMIRQKGDWKRLWVDKTVAQTTVPLYSGRASVDLDGVLGNSVGKGENYYIEYSLTRRNSRFSNDSESSANSTPEFRR